MIPNTSTASRVDGNPCVRPNAVEQEVVPEICGVETGSEGSEDRRESERETGDTLDRYRWLSSEGKREYRELMGRQGVQAGSEEWEKHADEYIERQWRATDEAEATETTATTVDTEREPIRGDGAGSAPGVREPDEEGRAVRTLRPVGCPTEEEWRQHRATHYPYRSWCPWC